MVMITPHITDHDAWMVIWRHFDPDRYRRLVFQPEGVQFSLEYRQEGYGQESAG